MEVDTKSPLHPIVQVTNQLSHEQIYILHLEEADQRGLFNAKGYNIDIFFVGYKEGETALRGKLFPPPWIYLELWSYSSG